MAISQLLPQTLALHERERLREALARRRLGLSAALDLYDDGGGATSTRRALVRHTQLAIADIDRALARADEPGYGVCRSCRRGTADRGPHAEPARDPLFGLHPTRTLRLDVTRRAAR